MSQILSVVPRWARVSAVVLGIGLGSEVLYEVYLSWRSWCAGRRARQRASLQFTEIYFANERSIKPDEPGTSMASFTTEHVRRIVTMLDRSRVSVNLCMYIITVESIGDALIRAAKRGVQVRVVGCSTMAYSSGSQMTRMVNEGIPVRFNAQNAASLMHHKFCLIDTDWMCDRCYHEEKVRKNGFCCGASSSSSSTQTVAGGPVNGSPRKVPCDLLPAKGQGQQGCVRCNRKLKSEVEKCKLAQGASGEAIEPLPLGGLVVSGSTNWTMQALSGNFDNMLVTSLPEIIVPFQLEFQRLWKEFAKLPSPINGPTANGTTALVNGN